MIEKKYFGHMPDGAVVDLFTLKNNAGAEVQVISYGAAIRSILVPDNVGTMTDVVLGFDTLEDYIHHRGCFGGTVGRYANRIKGGRFSLNGASYDLTKNEGENHLHGGFSGFDKQVWRGEMMGDVLRMQLHSPHGEEGYPGNLSVEVRYSLSEQNALTVEYSAISDADTVVNLTTHPYFNLNGHKSGDILKHRLTVYAQAYLPVDHALIPTGAQEGVLGTAMDFTVDTAIGENMKNAWPQLQQTQGYDHCFVLNAEKACRLVGDKSQIVLEVTTTQKGLQVYTGNHISGDIPGKDGVQYMKHAGIAIEAQNFPNAPNVPSFPSPILRKGMPYFQKTVFTFKKS